MIIMCLPEDFNFLLGFLVKYLCFANGTVEERTNIV